MSVEPGKCGQKFLPSACEKIRQLSTLRKNAALNFKISADGGINAETLPLADAAGADIFAMGSNFFANPEQWKEPFIPFSAY
jgi:ribulose-phosphate 3-epimerase